MSGHRKTFRRWLLVLSAMVVALLVCAPLALALEQYSYVAKWGGVPPVLNWPRGIHYYSNNLYVADTDNNRIVRYGRAGQMRAQYSGDTSTPLAAPTAVAVNPMNGNMYVAERHGRVTQLDSLGRVIRSWGAPGTGPGQFSELYGIAVAATGDVYVADTYNNRIQQFGPTGSFIRAWGSSAETPGVEPGEMYVPVGIDVDSAGRVYVMDSMNGRVQKFTSSGAFISQFYAPESENGMYYSAGLAVDPDGNVFVADTYGARILKFDAAGNFTAKFGAAGDTSGLFNMPEGVAADDSGYVYVADTQNSRIQRFIQGAYWTDNKPPVTTSNVTGGWYTAPATIVLSAEDSSSVDVTYYSTDGMAPQTRYVGPDTIYFDGYHTLKYYSADEWGNAEPVKTESIKIDQTPPVTTSNAKTSYNSYANISLSATDTLSGLVSTRWRMNGGPWSYTTTFTTDAIGTHLLEYMSNDVAGNWEATKTASFTVLPVGTRYEDTDPKIAYTGTWYTFSNASYSGGTQRYTSAANGVATVAFNGTGITLVASKVPDRGIALVSLDESPAVPVDLYSATRLHNQPVWSALNLTPGDHLIRIFWSGTKNPASTSNGVSFDAVDIAGEIRDAPDTNAPESTTNISSHWLRGPVSVEITATDDMTGVDNTTYRIDGGPWTAYTAPFEVSAQGGTIVEYYSRDKAGNTELVKSQTVWVDDLLPSTVASASAGWTRLPGVVTLNAYDTLSGVAEMYYSITGGPWTNTAGTVAVAAEGTQTVSFYAVDIAGNIEDMKSATVYVDGTAPSTLTDAAQSYIETASVQLTASDALSGLKATRWRLNGGEWTTGTVVMAAGPAYYGMNTLDYYSVDMVGNEEGATSVNFLVEPLDKDAPETQAQAPSGWTRPPAAISLTASDAISGVSATYYRLDNGETALYSPAAGLSVTDEGTHTVEYWSVDAVGNTETPKSLEVYVDDTRPSVSDDAESVYLAPSEITITSEDALSGVAETRWSIDNGPWYVGTTVPVMTPGYHSLTYYAVDHAGNESQPVVRDFVVDLLPPFTATMVPEGWVRGPLDIALDASDDVVGVAATYFRLLGSEAVAGTTVHVADEGETSFEYWSVDALGNTETTKTATVRIDNTAPVTTADAEESYFGTATISLTANDALSGVAKTEWRVDEGDWTTGTTVVLQQGGRHVVEFRSVDAAGNVEDTRRIDPTVIARFEQSDPRVRLEGTWGSWSYHLLSGGSYGYANTSGAAAVFAFRGTALDIIGLSAPSSGIARVVLDGVPTTVDMYSSATVYQDEHFSIAGLEDTTHTVRVEWTGKRNAAASNSYVNVDAFEIAGRLVPIPVDTTAPRTEISAPSGWTRIDSDVTLSAADDLSKVEAIYYRLNGGEWLPYTTAFRPAAGITLIEYYSVDAAGNAEAIRSHTVYLDKTAPQTTSNLDGTWKAEPVLVSLTPADGDSGTEVTYYSLGNGEWLTYSEPFLVSAEGATQLRFYSVDVAGNVESTNNAVVRVDTTAPVTAAGAPQGWSTSPVTLTLTPTDADSGVSRTYYTIDGSEEAVYGAPLLIDAEGTTDVTYRSVDAAGNSEAPKSVSIRVDTDSPVSQDDAPRDWVHGPVLVTLSTEENVSGLALFEYSLDGADFTPYAGPVLVAGDGTHRLTYRATDAAGNVEPMHEIDVRLDSTAPVTSYSAPSGWSASPVAVDLDAIDTGSGVAATFYRTNGAAEWQLYSSPFNVADEGVTLLEYYSVDFLGNAEAPSAATIRVDTRAPLTTSDAADTWSRETVGVTLTATDENAGVEATHYRIGDGPSALYDGSPIVFDAEGETTLEFSSFDKAANVEPTRTATVRIDRTAPITTADVKDSYAGTASISLSPTDTLSGVAVTRWRLDSGDWVVGTSAVVTAGGRHTLEWSSTDAAGNSEETKSATFSIVRRIEQTAAEVRLEGTWATWNYHLLSGGSYRAINTSGGAAVFSFRGTAVDLIALKGTNMGLARVTLDSGEPELVDMYSPTATYQAKVWGVSGLEDAVHTVRVEWTGKRTTGSSNFNINVDAFDIAGDPVATSADTTAPVTRATAPTGWVSTDATVTLTASDSNSGVDRIEYRIADGAWTTYSVPFKVVSHGTTVVAFRAVDRAGNIEPEQSISVRIDKTLPEASSSADGTWSGQPVTVSLSAEDTDSGIAVIRYRIADGEWNVYDEPLVVATEGTTTVEYYAEDVAGNRGATESALVRIDQTGPTVASSASSGWIAGPASITLTATDGGSGVASILYSLDGSVPSLPYTGPILLAAPGDVVLRYAADDAVGNVVEAPPVALQVDTLAPVTTPDPADGWYGSEVEVALSAQDEGSGVDEIRYRLPGGAWTRYAQPVLVTAEGQTSLEYYAIDKAGKAEDVRVLTLGVDRTPPLTMSDAPSGWTNGDVPVTLTPIDTGSGVGPTLYRIGSGDMLPYLAPILVTAEGETSIEFKSVDVLGNAEETRTATVKIDRTAPVTTHNAPSGWATGTVNLALTPYDAASGTASTRYTINGGQAQTYTAPIVISQNGTAVVEFASIDAAGNSETSQTVTVLVDKTPPASTTDAMATYIGAATVKISATDSVSGVSAIRYRLNGGTWTTGSTITTTAAGTHTLEYAATDVAGNVEPTKQVTFIVTGRVEQTDARMRKEGVWGSWSYGLLSGGSYGYTNAAGGALVAGFNGTGAELIALTGPSSGIARITVDDRAPVLVDLYSSSTVYQARAWSVTGLPAGFHTLRIEWTGTKRSAASNTHINVDALEITGMIDAAPTTDTAAPKTTFSPGESWQTTDTTVTLLPADSVSGVERAHYRIGESAWTTYTAPFKISAQGETSLEFYAVDKAGNVEVTKSGKVRIDKTMPSTTSDAKASYMSSATISLTASDSPSGLAGTYWRLNGGNWYSGTTVVVSTAGSYKLEYYSRDEAGNTEPTRTAAFTVMNRFEQNDARTRTLGTWGSWSYGMLSGGNYGYTNSLGGVFVAAFDGTAIDLVALKGATSGKAAVSVDGGTPAIVDLFANPAQYKQTVWGVTGLTPGVHILRVEFTGSKNTSASNTYVNVDALDIAGTLVPMPADTTAPVTSSSVSGWVGATTKVALSVREDLSTVASTKYRIDGGAWTTYTAPFTMPTEGSSTLEYYSVDSAGNTETVRAETVQVDRTAPLTTTDAAPSYPLSASVQLTSADALSGVAATRFRLDGGAWTTGTVVTTTIGGQHTLEYLAIDAAGNSEATKTATFVVARHQETDARIRYEGTWGTWSYPSLSGGAYKYASAAGGAATIAFKGTGIEWLALTGPSSGKASITVDGGAAQLVDLYSPQTAYQQKVWSVSGLADGQHIVRIEWTGQKNPAASRTTINFDALDIAGYITTAPADSAPPVTSSNIPGSWVTGNQTVTLTAADASPIAATRYRLNGSAWTTYTAPFLVSDEGTTSVEYFSVDSGGNTEAPKSASLRIDKTTPVTSANTVSVYAAEATITLTAADTVSGVGSTRYRIDGGAWQTGSTAVVTVGGQHMIEYYSIDKAGNAEDIRSATFTVLRYQENDPLVRYTGTWGSWTNSGLSGGAYRYIATTGGAAEVTFEGTSITWTALKAISSGKARVLVDGVETAIVDLYSPTNSFRQPVFTASGLTQGTHTLRIEWTGTKNASATNTYINVDAFDTDGKLVPAQ